MTSLIITRTNKGQNLFNSIEMDLRWKDIYGPLWKRIGRKIKHTIQYTISNRGAKSK